MSFNLPNTLNLETIRAAYPVLQRVTYLNVGTYGIMPEPAVKTFIQILSEFEQNGVASNHEAHHKTEETRRRIAEMVHCESAEIAFTRNATDGINLVLAGIDWQAGDEVITTVQEHEAMIHPLLYLQKTRGIVVKFVEVSPEPETMLNQLEQQATARTRLVGMSLVTCETGTRLPAQEICRWAADKNIRSLFDGAQSTGVFPVDVTQIGCDFYASNGHKWLSGPKGTGFFYGKLARILELSPAHVGAGSLEKVDILSQTAEPWNTAQRFEFGTRSWGVTAGLSASLDWFESLGWEAVYTHIANLSSYFKELVLATPSLQLLSPIPFKDSSGLVSFCMEGHQAGEVAKQLREAWHFTVRVIPHYNALRISTAHFNTPQDVEHFLEAIVAITK